VTRSHETLPRRSTGLCQCRRERFSASHVRSAAGPIARPGRRSFPDRRERLRRCHIEPHSESVKRAVVGTLRWRVRFGALECPGEDEGEGVDVTVGQNRISEIGPAIAHQVGALEQVRGVP
jgi:hypothetical protein